MPCDCRLATTGTIGFVLCRVEMQDFVVDDLYAVRYDRIRDLLARDEVELV